MASLVAAGVHLNQIDDYARMMFYTELKFMLKLGEKKKALPPPPPKFEAPNTLQPDNECSLAVLHLT